MGNDQARPGKDKKKKKKSKGKDSASVRPSKNDMNGEIEEGREYNLVMIGDGGVGKTAITVQFVSGRFIQSYDPTVEDAYRKPYTIEGKNITLEIIDTAGQEEYSSGLLDKFIRQGEGFVCVYSITSAESFEKMKNVKQRLCWTKDQDEVALVLVGNKLDLEKDRKVQREEGEALAKEFDCQFIEASAKTGANVVEVIHLLLKEVANVNELHRRYPQD